MLRFDPLYYPYPSRRLVQYARAGMVATAQPLAAQAGLSILQQGGNAIDAAVATAAALTVLEPTSNGIGSDAFVLLWTKGQLHGLNSSGPAPQTIPAAEIRSQYDAMPEVGWLPVTVPGAPAAWAELCQRFGRLTLPELLRPAIHYAESGYAVPADLGYHWQRAYQSYRKTLQGPQFRPWFECFAPEGRAPRTGELWRSPEHGKSLRRIAESNAADFYQGELAEAIAQDAQAHGGFLTKEDLMRFRPEWVTPISASYRGFDVWELPPNGQGLITLMALQILAGFPTTADPVEYTHRSIEALKLAFVDGTAHIADPNAMRVSVEQLLSPAYAEQRREAITDQASSPQPGIPQGGTVYLAAADSEGSMVSFIQSNYRGFGSGIVIPGTGISLQNRGACFSLDPDHPNQLEPGKRPYHTIIPGFLTKDGQPVGAFGVMGGFMQPQGHLQVLQQTLDHQLNPQAALDAPRWQWVKGRQLLVEHHFPSHAAAALSRRGHDVRLSHIPSQFGRGQIIWRSNDTLVGGTEPRADGGLAGF